MCPFGWMTLIDSIHPGHVKAHVEKITELFSRLGANKTGVITYGMFEDAWMVSKLFHDQCLIQQFFIYQRFGIVHYKYIDLYIIYIFVYYYFLDWYIDISIGQCFFMCVCLYRRSHPCHWHNDWATNSLFYFCRCMLRHVSFHSMMVCFHSTRYYCQTWLTQTEILDAPNTQNRDSSAQFASICLPNHHIMLIKSLLRPLRKGSELQRWLSTLKHSATCPTALPSC